MGYVGRIDMTSRLGGMDGLAGECWNDMNDWLDECFTGFVRSLTSVYIYGRTFVCDGSLDTGCIGNDTQAGLATLLFHTFSNEQ